MQTLIGALVVAIVSVMIGSLLTFLITTVSQRKVTKSIIKELIDTHEKIYHKKPMEDVIKDHHEACSSINDTKTLQTNINLLIGKIAHLETCLPKLS